MIEKILFLMINKISSRILQALMLQNLYNMHKWMHKNDLGDYIMYINIRRLCCIC